MHPLKYIRKNVLGITQSAMADLAGVSQGTVSRWEDGELTPDLEQMNRIRHAARERRSDWDDSWFFSPPPFPVAGGRAKTEAAA